MDNKLWDLRKFSDNIALLDEANHSLTYDQLADEAEGLINKIDISRSLVFSLCTNSIGSVLGYTAFVNSGKAVPVQLSSNLDESLLQNLLATYEPRYLWIPRGLHTDLFAVTVDIIQEAHGYVLLKTKIEK